MSIFRPMIDISFRTCPHGRHVRIRDIETADLAKRQTASHWLTTLAGAGLLEEARSDGRQKVFINRDALGILT
jgi:hypothetical protein